MTPRHQKPVPEDIDDTSRDQPYHRKRCPSFVTQNIIHHAAARHKRRRNQNEDGIRLCIRQNRVRTSQQAHQRFEKQKSQYRNQSSGSQRAHKRGRRKPRGALYILRAEPSGDNTSRSMPKHKSESLNNCHQSKHYADRSRSTCPELPDKIGVRHIINICDQHADCRRYAKHNNEL